METKNKYARGGANASKKLLAALAVLAVALIALVAVPAVDANGNDTAEVPSGTNGDTTMTADSVLSFTTDGKTTYYGANDMEALAVKIEKATGEVTIKVLKDFEFNTSIATNTGYLGTKATVTFDGDGKTLTAEGAALFSRINYGTFTFTDLTITGTVNEKYAGDNDSIGAFINQTGYDEKSLIVTFERCNVTGAVIYDGYYAGGFIGYPTKGSTISFDECKVDGNTKITGIKRAGGFLGLAYSDVTMEDCTIENTTVKNLFDAEKVADNEKDDNKAYNKWRVGLAASIFNMKGGEVDISRFTIGPGNTLIQGFMKESEAEYISIAVPEGYKGTEFVVSVKDEADLTVDNTEITAGNGNFIPYANGEISVDEEFVVPAGCELNADIVLSDGAEVVFGAGSSYTGTITHVELVNEENESRTNTAVFDNIRFSGKSVVAAGSLELQAEIDAAAENGGTVTLTGNVVITDDVVVKSGVKIVIEGEADVTIENEASFKFETGSELEVKQNANVASEGNGKVVIESGVEITGAGSIDADVEVDDSTMETAYLSGTIETGVKGPNQRVVIDKDSTIVGELKIFGQLEIPEGVTVTVKAGGKIILDSVYTSVISGTLIMEGADEDNKKDAAVLEITTKGAVLEVAGTFSIEGDLVNEGKNAIKVLQGADVTIGTEGSVNGMFEVGDSAKLNIAGEIKDGTVFDVKGTLTIDSSKQISESFTVNLENGAVLDIVGIVLGDYKTITVADPGTVIYDGKDKEKNTTQPSDVENKLILAGTANVDTPVAGTTPGAEITGLKVVSTMKSSKIGTTDTYYKSYNNNYKHVYTMGISGSVAVAPAIEYGKNYVADDYDEKLSALEVTMVLTGGTGAEISDALSLARDVGLTLQGTVAVKGAVALAYVAADTSAANTVYTSKAGYGSIIVAADAKVKVTAPVVATASSAAVDLVSNEFGSGNGKIELSGDGSITVSKQLDSTNGVSAAYYKLVTGTGASQVVTHVYTTADSAIAKLADGSVTEATIYGTQAVNTSAEVPAKAVLTVQNGAKLAIGKDDKAVDVILTIASGATFKAASGSAEVKVNGTLYAQDRTNVKSTLAITSAVVSYEMNGDKEVKQGWAKWTNLTTALAEAESGQRIVLNDEVDLAVNTVVPEGVTLDANGKRVLVECGVTLTVDGTLDLTDAGSVLTIAKEYVNNEAPSKNQPAASIILNGTILVDEGSVVEVGLTMETSGLVYTKTSSGRIITAAYYEDSDGVTHITTVASAAAAIKDAEVQKVQLRTYGDEVLSFSNVSFAGNADATEGIATVEVHGPVTASGVTLADAQIVFVAPVTSGAPSTIRASLEVAGADGSAVLKGAFSNGFTVGSTSYGDDVEAVLGISGIVEDYRDKTADKDVATQVVLDGTVYILGAASITTDEIVVSGTVSIVKAANAAFGASAGTIVLGGTTDTVGSKNKATSVTVSGTLAICDGVTVVSEKQVPEDGNAANYNEVEVLVSGTVAVKSTSASGWTVDVMTVSGTVDASATSETTLKYTGAVTVSNKLYVGVTSKIESSKDIADEVFTSTAAVTGNVKVAGYAVKAAGAVVPAGWTADDSAASASGALKIGNITVFTVGETTGADEYITVFNASGSKKIADFRLATVDSEFKGWKNSKGKIAVTDMGTEPNALDETKYEVAKVGDPNWKTVEAKIDKNVFEIRIVTDGGIGRITLNGVLMDGSGNSFDKNELIAGSYTVEFAAAAGYDASKVVLTDMDGNVLNTKTILINDETSKDSGRVLEFQLVGSEVAASSGGSSGGMSHDDAQGIIDAIDKNTDAVKNQPAGGSADNSLTNILLIVLVVLIVIMAALVAMRMMRS